MGIFGIALAALILLMILYCVLKSCAAKVKKCCGAILDKMQKTLFFGAFIRYMLEGCLKLSWTNLAIIGSAYAGFESSVGKPADDISIYVSIGFVVLVVFFLTFSMILLLVRRERL